MIKRIIDQFFLAQVVRYPLSSQQLTVLTSKLIKWHERLALLSLLTGTSEEELEKTIIEEAKHSVDCASDILDKRLAKPKGNND